MDQPRTCYTNKNHVLREACGYRSTARATGTSAHYAMFCDHMAAIFALMWLVTPDPGEERTVLEIPFSSYQRYATVRDGHFYGRTETFVIPPGKYKLVKVL